MYTNNVERMSVDLIMRIHCVDWDMNISEIVCNKHKKGEHAKLVAI